MTSLYAEILDHDVFNVHKSFYFVILSFRPIAQSRGQIIVRSSHTAFTAMSELTVLAVGMRRAVALSSPQIGET